MSYIIVNIFFCARKYLISVFSSSANNSGRWPTAISLQNKYSTLPQYLPFEGCYDDGKEMPLQTQSTNLYLWINPNTSIFCNAIWTALYLKYFRIVAHTHTFRIVNCGVGHLNITRSIATISNTYWKWLRIKIPILFSSLFSRDSDAVFLRNDIAVRTSYTTTITWYSSMYKDISALAIPPT